MPSSPHQLGSSQSRAGAGQSQPATSPHPVAAPCLPLSAPRGQWLLYPQAWGSHLAGRGRAWPLATSARGARSPTRQMNDNSGLVIKEAHKAAASKPWHRGARRWARGAPQFTMASGVLGERHLGSQGPGRGELLELSLGPWGLLPAVPPTMMQCPSGRLLIPIHAAPCGP